MLLHCSCVYLFAAFGLFMDDNCWDLSLCDLTGKEGSATPGTTPGTIQPVAQAAVLESHFKAEVRSVCCSFITTSVREQHPGPGLGYLYPQCNGKTFETQIMASFKTCGLVKVS